MTGFFNPTVTHPTFLTPIFLSGNQWYVQELDDDGRTLAFHPTEIVSADLIGLPQSPAPDIIQTEGEDGYWAFQASATGTVLHGRGKDMTRSLKGCLDDPAVLASPFVHLDIVRFVGDRDREEAALRRVFEDLALHSREDAEFWRDLSILLPAVKDGLRGMKDEAVSEELYERFVRIASVRVEGKTPFLLTGQALYDFIHNRRPTFRTAMREPNRLARIFDLNDVTPKARPGGPKGVSLEPQSGQTPDTADTADDASAPARRGTGKSRLSLLRDLVKTLEVNIRERLDDDPTLNAPLDREWTDAREVGRTAISFQEWRKGEITQAAVHWVLSAVFVRFLEDNRLIDDIWLSGPTAERREAARDHHQEFVRRNPSLSDRDYLLDAFQTVAGLPGMGPLFDPRHNPVWRLQPTGDGAEALIDFFQKPDPASAALLFDLTRPDLNTRFLGDLYQDLSEATRARYALLQTPEFVEEFILDRTLEPAVREYGLTDFRIIDPTCGSGHFLLGAFHRLLDHWRTEDPNAPPRAWVQRALGSVHGVDLNPFAVAIARFRLLIAALAASGIHRLEDAPDFPLNLAIGDSLLHGRHFGQMDLSLQRDNTNHAKTLRHVYHAEDPEALARILGQQYHAVVGNPPFITVKDKALNQAYRERFSSCHRAYALSAPFIERFFDLAMDGRLQWMRLTKADGTESLVRPGDHLKRATVWGCLTSPSLVTSA
ncbi:BREX-2 system adenine-specific DNA-methyltransferase PglX [Azospirillum cavernae]|uniref:site-specific DNA-methyltransferase (adenine-specific) n=1 Tax=Azospirillum cavernae TaxID=2320860 RepID=A0A418W2B7_9PROT|nr:BREX-2 system adenine-specific DNA-methyltransferase PglX [Azospirillum cavernae]